MRWELGASLMLSSPSLRLSSLHSVAMMHVHGMSGEKWIAATVRTILLVTFISPVSSPRLRHWKKKNKGSRPKTGSGGSDAPPSLT